MALLPGTSRFPALQEVSPSYDEEPRPHDTLREARRRGSGFSCYLYRREYRDFLIERTSTVITLRSGTPRRPARLYDRSVDRRRTILLLTFGLLVGAMAASLWAGPSETTKKPIAPRSRDAVRRPDLRPVRVELDTGLLPRQAPARRIPSGSHVVLEVAAATDGQVEVRGLGLNQPATELTPAVFDVIPPDGTYLITFTPVRGEGRTVGRLRVGSRAGPSAQRE